MAADRNTLPEGLLEDVKNALDITWGDEGTDRKYEGIIALGMVYLNGKLGADADYTKDSLARLLLFEYVRYARDAALDVFEHNYMAHILAMQNERAVSLYAESTKQTE